MAAEAAIVVGVSGRAGLARFALTLRVRASDARVFCFALADHSQLTQGCGPELMRLSDAYTGCAGDFAILDVPLNEVMT
jgi:hypothetical protein